MDWRKKSGAFDQTYRKLALTPVTLCAPGEALLGTGFIFTEPGNREVSFLRAAPFLASTGNGVTGEIASNSGGTAKAQIMAICLGG